MPDKSINEIFCKNLEDLLSKNNMTYSNLAQILGINKSTISMWKTGKNLPRMELLDRIADYFGITVAELTTDNSCIVPKFPFTSKDEQDIKKSLDRIMGSLETKDGAPLYYDGNELELTDENKAMLRDALNTALHTVKLINKEKYNPHKNGK